jgi:Zn-dependent M28 family amino/carboxypeptidase
VVVGAHYDHLGYGGRSSLAPDKNKKQIHYGADDNASGTAALIELARAFGQQPKREGRRLVFMAFSAEEMGLLGSRHYCEKQPIFPLDSTVAMVNLDMVGRMAPDGKSKKGVLTIQGVGTAKNFKELVDGISKETDFHVVKKEGGIGPSDHASFYRKNIPVLFFFTGTHKDYHRPSDTAEKINYGDMVAITALAERITQTLATDRKRPEYVKVAGGDESPGIVPGMPKLGIMPNYASDAKGVLVGGVKEGGPAEKGGLKAGDQIVEIAGKQVTGIENYMVIMGQQRAGQPLEIRVLREGKELKLRVTPQ